MKRIVFVIFAVFAVIGSLFAQDIIVTASATRINASVIEIGDTEISYKMFDNPDGRLFTIAKEDVVSVLMGNGKVFVFGKPQVESEHTHVAEIHCVLPGTITKKEHHYYLNTSYGIEKMSTEAYLRFIAHNCPEAWMAYEKADHLWSLGWRFFGSGMAGIVLGLPVWGAGVALQNKANANDPFAYYGRGMQYAGIILGATGMALTVASVPMLSVGQHRRQNAYEIYNACYLEQHHTSEPEPDLTLRFQVAPGSAGIALCF